MNYVIIIVLIKIIFIIILFYKKKIENFQSCNYNHLVLSKNQLKETKELFLEFLKIAKKYKIKYFAMAGTLIGTIRNGGLIPYDDDIDLGILFDDIHKIHKYSNKNYYFQVFVFGYKFKKRGSNIFIDLFLFEKDKNIYKVINNLYPKEAIKEDELFPLTPKKFNNIQINVPYKYKKYLNRAFNDWDKTLVIDCGHMSDTCITEKYNLPKKMPTTFENSVFMCYTDFDKITNHDYKRKSK